MRGLIILEDEPILRAELATYLRARGFIVDEVASIAGFRASYDPARHLAALLDLGLPDGDGMALISELRASGEKLGIVILTARNTGRSKIEGLLTGADHFFHKPVDLEELTATLQALLRRLETGGVNPRWTLDTLQCRLLPPGKPPIRLTAQGYIVL
ncbi:MAG: response regulator, partial [Hyphomicrobiales bacterium]|nr:response regulator [Hyphomicrobiales bacterium]